MVRKDERWLNQSGLNLIRIVIGSYFVAVSLDLVSGVNQKALFLPFFPTNVADLIGSTILCVASFTFMLGLSLRQTALALALFVFCSSLIHNFLLLEFEDISAFWRDVALVCAIILNYSNMNRHELRRADLMRRRRVARVRKIRLPGEEVTPRRVASPAPETQAAPRQARPVLDLPSFMKPPADRADSHDRIDINLFANI